MSGRQRHKAKMISRLKERWENAVAQEENLRTVIRDQMMKAEKRYLEVLQLEDTSVFLQQYGKVVQTLDSVNIMLDHLTLAAEDIIVTENGGAMAQAEVVLDDAMSLMTEKSVLTSTMVHDEALSTSVPTLDTGAGRKQLLERQHSDEQIKRELQEMIQGCKRHSCLSPEATINTSVSEKLSVNRKQSEDLPAIISQAQMFECRRKQSESVCEQTQTVSDNFHFGAQSGTNFSELKEPVCEQTQTDEQLNTVDEESDFLNEVYESSVSGDPDSVMVASSRGTEKENSVDSSAVLRKQISAVDQFTGSEISDKELETACKGKEKFRDSGKQVCDNVDRAKVHGDSVVPTNVRKHLNKESSQSTYERSSPLDAKSFGENVTSSSSPKGSETPQKKKSPKKKKGKTNSAEDSRSQSLVRTTSKPEIQTQTVKEKSKVNTNKDKEVNRTDEKSEEQQDEMNILEKDRKELQELSDEHVNTVESEDTGVISDKATFKPIVEDQEIKDVNKNLISVPHHLESPTSNQLTLNITESQQRDSAASMPTGTNQGVTELIGGSLLTGKITPIVVSEVVSPWCFFVQQNGPQLNHLMEQICMHMSQGGLVEPPILNPYIGTVCLARYSKDNAFYRAYVMQTYIAIQKTKSEVDVLYVDYGNRERVKVTQLRRLPDKFKTLPMQAICCALAEIMPSNKYCIWNEGEINLFRQYVIGQQLSCTPPSSRSSAGSLPLLVELIVSYPVPAMTPGGIYLSQFSIAQLMIKANKGRSVEVAEQIGLLAKSGEGAEEAAILSPDRALASGVSIKELVDSKLDTPADKHNLVQDKVSDSTKASERGGREIDAKQRIDLIGVNQDSSKDGRRDLMSPRSELSETESQMGEGHKGPQRGMDKATRNAQVEGPLQRIKEEQEVADMLKSETASVATSDTTDLDFPQGQGYSLSDLHFDINDLKFKPNGQEVMLSHVKTPSEFYVNVISQQSGETLDKLMKNLNALFEKVTRRKLTNLSKKLEIAENKLCCAQFMQDNNFYRGIILSTKPEKETMKGRILVHYIDFGDEEWLPRRRIFPLPAQFCTVPRLAIRCSLAYIKPVCSESGDLGKWSAESIKKFVDIAGLEKTLHVHVVGGCLEEATNSSPEKDPVGLNIMLVDNTGTEEVCVNMDLINEGLAQLDTAAPNRKPVGDQDSREKSAEFGLDGWNPMEDDFFSKRNSYLIDTDDPGVATAGYRMKEDNICRFYGLGKNCWKGERCPYRHVRIESGMTYEQVEVYATSGNQVDILPSPGSWVALEISTILSPCHFYVILPMGSKSLDATYSETENTEGAFGETGSQETLDDLLAAMSKAYDKRPIHQTDVWLKAKGEIVVARYSRDHQWYRARVIDVTEEKVKVFFVDFGNTEWLPEGEIETIKPEFLLLPFQAIECSLYGLEAKGQDQWSRDAKLEFRELVDGKTLVGHIKTSSWNGCLSLELYDTSTPVDINIADKLVEKGYATYAESSAPTKSQAEGEPEVIFVPG